MADYTSALYLGFSSAWSSLASWDSLTTGVPAALREAAQARVVESQVARLVGREAAILWPSTLHLFWDVLLVLSRSRATLLVDKGAYPVSSWGAQAATLQGARLMLFDHHDPQSLAQVMSIAEGTPVIVSDGYCVGCGVPAPLAEYAQLATENDGYLVVDDTQAMGIWGERPNANMVYGNGGGGSLARAAVASDRAIWSASLAKGLGAPLAALSGSAALVDELRRSSPTRVHTSPPNAASIAAAHRALQLNLTIGQARRKALLTNVRRLRRVLFSLGFTPLGGVFPVQRIRSETEERTAELHKFLMLQNVQVPLVRARCTGKLEVAFLVTAEHTPEHAEEVRAALIQRTVDRRVCDVDNSGWVCSADSKFSDEEMGAGTEAAWTAW